MIDEKGNVITRKEILKNYYSFIKENTAQIAIVIPHYCSYICRSIELLFLYS